MSVDSGYERSNNNEITGIRRLSRRRNLSGLLLPMLLLGSSFSLVTQAGVNILPPSTVKGIVDKDTKQQIGDVDIPTCNSYNLGFNTTLTDYGWTVTSEIGSGSTVFVGQEWKVTFQVGHQTPHKPGLPNTISVGNDGLDPLYLSIPPQGPVDDGGISPIGEIPDGFIWGGKGDRALITPVGSWKFMFDEDTDPNIFQGSDPVAAKITVNMRASAPGVITLPNALVSGYDDSPIAGEVTCGPMPVNMSWTVIENQGLDMGPLYFRTDARYNNAHILDETSGLHGVLVDVLSVVDDPNVPGGPGDINEVRIRAWNENTGEGGTFVCGTAQQNNPPEGTPFTDLATGPCVYTPPMNHAGGDYFKVEVVGLSGNYIELGMITVDNIVANTAPQIAAPGFGVTNGVDEVFDMSPSINDPENDPVSCFANGNASPAGVGTATVNADCTIEWDNTNPGFTGNVSVPFTACDTHATLTNLGSQGSRSVAYSNGDLNNSATRRCTDGTATIAILNGLIIPPTGVTDKDIVDAGYAADGVGAYTIRIPVLDNDTDGNGPKPVVATAALAILTPPAANEGTAGFDGDKLVFTPADGFSGTVTMTYRVCEDPALQNPPYFDDPNTPLVNEGLPYCGVGSVSIKVIPNAAPTVINDTKTIADNVILSGFDLGANDSDPDGDPISCTAGTPVASNPGLVTSASVSADCKLSFDPVDGQAGVVEFTYEVCDQHTLSFPSYPAIPYGDPDGLAPGADSSRCSSGIATITVALSSPPNPDPLDADPEPECNADVGTTGKNTAVSINVIANDLDLDENLQAATVILTGPPADEPDVSAAGGSVKMNGQNTILYTPPQDYVGQDDFSYTARDEVGQACKANVHITINAAPGGAADAVGVPTLSRWMLLLLLSMVAIAGAFMLRTYRR